MINFEKKYLKYKNKYINLQNYKGGTNPALLDSLNDKFIDIKNLGKYKYCSTNRKLTLETAHEGGDYQASQYFYITNDNEKKNKIISGFSISKEELLIIDFELNDSTQDNPFIYYIKYIDPTLIFNHILGDEYIKDMNNALSYFSYWYLDLNAKDVVDWIIESDEFVNLTNSTYSINFHNIYYLMCFLYSKELEDIFTHNLINFSFKFFKPYTSYTNLESLIALFYYIIIIGLNNSIIYLDYNVNVTEIQQIITCIMKSIFVSSYAKESIRTLYNSGTDEEKNILKILMKHINASSIMFKFTKTVCQDYNTIKNAKILFDQRDDRTLILISNSNEERYAKIDFIYNRHRHRFEQ